MNMDPAAGDIIQTSLFGTATSVSLRHLREKVDLDLTNAS